MPAKTIGHFLFLLTCGFFLPSLALAQYAQKTPPQPDPSRAVVENFFELLSKNKVEEAANLISENATIQPKVKGKTLAELIREKKVLQNKPRLITETIVAGDSRVAVEVESGDSFTNPEDKTPLRLTVQYSIHCEVRDGKIVGMSFYMRPEGDAMPLIGCLPCPWTNRCGPC